MHRNISPSGLILLSFAGIIAAGACLLMLPAAGADRPLTFLEALFTATSATCVTGLSVFDIGTRLTIFGQAVVLLLIQTGGLGIMTFSTFFIYLVSRRLSIRNREVLLQSLSQHPIRDMGRLLLAVFQVTFVFETAGAVCLWLRLRSDFSEGRAVYLAVFHSISAFCNAGFSLLQNSLMDYRDDVGVNLMVMFLVVSGGLGFIVLFDLVRTCRARIRGTRVSLSYHSRIVLLSSGWLIAGGAAALLCCEWFNTLHSCGWTTRLLAPLFQSVSARTCGFNTIPIGNLTDASLVVLAVLMFIGASPASTGGGIKTSTMTILLAMIAARFKNQEDVNLLNRRVSQDIVSRAMSVAFCAALLIGCAVVLVVLFENGASPHPQTHDTFLELLFEAVSAFGTVGLSTGITSALQDTSKIVLILLMYIGRVGPLLLAIELAGGARTVPYRLPEEEHILIG